MQSPAHLFDSLRAQGIDFFTGVPDSLLKDFCAYVTDHTDASEHVIAANEGNAVGLAAGHYLGSGRPALVYMQNSGLGNTVNPLLSLADVEVYSMPMLLMVGWRGEPGVKDEPQHVKQGRVTPTLLDAMELPYFNLAAGTPDAAAMIATACRLAVEESRPVVLLVSKGTFESYKLQRDTITDYPMNREQAIQCIVDLLDADDIVISTTGKASRELYEYRAARGDGHGNDFLTVGSMGHTSSIAMGVARCRPGHRTLCLDGDGSAIMHMGAMAIVGQSGLTNLVHVILNNGAHDSVGGQPTTGFAIQLGDIARACGYAQILHASSAEEVGQAFAQMAEGPVLLEIRVNKGARKDLGRPKSTPVENREALMARVQAARE